LTKPTEASKSQKNDSNFSTKGGGLYFVYPVIVIVTVIVLLQCLSCSFGKNYETNIADMHYDYDYKQMSVLRHVLGPDFVEIIKLNDNEKKNRYKIGP
jgi:hypothetical protein